MSSAQRRRPGGGSAAKWSSARACVRAGVGRHAPRLLHKALLPLLVPVAPVQLRGDALVLRRGKRLVLLLPLLRLQPQMQLHLRFPLPCLPAGVARRPGGADCWAKRLPASLSAPLAGAVRAAARSALWCWVSSAAARAVRRAPGPAPVVALLQLLEVGRQVLVVQVAPAAAGPCPVRRCAPRRPRRVRGRRRWTHFSSSSCCRSSARRVSSRASCAARGWHAGSAGARSGAPAPQQRAIAAARRREPRYSAPLLACRAEGRQAKG